LAKYYVNNKEVKCENVETLRKLINNVLGNYEFLVELFKNGSPIPDVDSHLDDKIEEDSYYHLFTMNASTIKEHNIELLWSMASVLPAEGERIKTKGLQNDWEAVFAILPSFIKVCLVIQKVIKSEKLRDKIQKVEDEILDSFKIDKEIIFDSDKAIDVLYSLPTLGEQTKELYEKYVESQSNQ